MIQQHDIRDMRIAAKLNGHDLQMCGLEWNIEGTTLANVGNENYVCICDVAMSERRNSLHAENDFVQLSMQSLSTRLSSRRWHGVLSSPQICNIWWLCGSSFRSNGISNSNELTILTFVCSEFLCLVML